MNLYKLKNNNLESIHSNSFKLEKEIKIWGTNSGYNRVYNRDI